MTKELFNPPTTVLKATGTSLRGSICHFWSDMHNYYVCLEQVIELFSLGLLLHVSSLEDEPYSRIVYLHGCLSSNNCSRVVVGGGRRGEGKRGVFCLTFVC